MPGSARNSCGWCGSEGDCGNWYHGVWHCWAEAGAGCSPRRRRRQPAVDEFSHSFGGSTRLTGKVSDLSISGSGSHNGWSLWGKAGPRYPGQKVWVGWQTSFSDAKCFDWWLPCSTRPWDWCGTHCFDYGYSVNVQLGVGFGVSPTIIEGEARVDASAWARWWGRGQMSVRMKGSAKITVNLMPFLAKGHASVKMCGYFTHTEVCSPTLQFPVAIAR